MCPTSGMSMPMGLCSSTPSRHQPSIALSTTTTTSAPQRTRLAKSGAQTSVLKQVRSSLWALGFARGAGFCLLFSTASWPIKCRTRAAALGSCNEMEQGEGQSVGWEMQLGGLWRVSGECGVAAAWWQESSSPFELGLPHPTTNRGFSQLWEELGHICPCWGPLSVPQPCSHCSTQPQLAKAY